MKPRVLLDRALTLRPFRRITRGLFRSSLAGMGILNHENFRISGEEHFVMHDLSRLFDSREPVVFDVGANQGDYAELVLRGMPGAKLYAFEPHPVTHAALAKRLASRARCFELALGETSGKLELFDHADHDGSVHATPYRAVIEEIYGRPSVPHVVAVSTVDAEVRSLGVDRIDFLKVDTEGHELAVIKGAKETIQSGRVGVVQFEFNEMNVVSRTFLHDFLEHLAGFSFFRLLPGGLLPLGAYKAVTWEIFAFQNIVALSPQLADRAAKIV